MSEPVKRIRYGNISATIFNNTREINGKEVEIKNVQIQRIFKDRDGNWKGTSSYRVSDLPKLALAASKVFEYLTIRSED